MPTFTLRGLYGRLGDYFTLSRAIAEARSYLSQPGNRGVVCVIEDVTCGSRYWTFSVENGLHIHGPLAH